MKKKDVALMGILAAAGITALFLLKPTVYPKTIRRGFYSFTAYNSTEEIALKEFLGINPPGVTLDEYLSAMTTEQEIKNWAIYWVQRFQYFTDYDSLYLFVNSKMQEYLNKLTIIY